MDDEQSSDGCLHVGGAAGALMLGALSLLARVGDDVARTGFRAGDELVATGGITRGADDLSFGGGSTIDEAYPKAGLGRPYHALDNVGRADVERPLPATNRVLLVSPDTEDEARLMFAGTESSEDAGRSVREAREASRRTDGATRQESASAMLRALKESDESYVTIIGHNDEARLVFPDGSRLDLTVLSARCREAGKFCIVLSCNSRSYTESGSVGMAARLSYRDAAIIAGQVRRLISRSDGRVSPIALRRSIMMTLDVNSLAIGSRAGVRVGFVPAGLLGTGAMAVRYGESDRGRRPG